MQKDWKDTSFYFEEIPNAFLWFEKIPIWQWQENIAIFIDYFFSKIKSYNTSRSKKFL